MATEFRWVYCLICDGHALIRHLHSITNSPIRMSHPDAEIHCVYIGWKLIRHFDCRRFPIDLSIIYRDLSSGKFVVVARQINIIFAGSCQVLFSVVTSELSSMTIDD